MKLSEAHKDLINLLKMLKLDKKSIMAIVMAMEEEKEAIELMLYLADEIENKTQITEELIAKKVLKMLENK